MPISRSIMLHRVDRLGNSAASQNRDFSQMQERSMQAVQRGTWRQVAEYGTVQNAVPTADNGQYFSSIAKFSRCSPRETTYVLVFLSFVPLFVGVRVSAPAHNFRRNAGAIEKMRQVRVTTRKFSITILIFYSVRTKLLVRLPRSTG